MTLESDQEQAMYYDDHFMIAVNDIVVAGTDNKLIDMLNVKGDNALPLYKWEDIVGNVWETENGKSQQAYCLGNSSYCSWPKTQQQGKMTVNIEKDSIMKIMALDINRNNHDIMFTTTGDNDSSDCKHSKFKFNVKVKFGIEAQTM